MKAPKRVVSLTPQEHKLVIQGLIEVRNTLIAESKCSNIFDDILIKMYKAKRRSQINQKTNEDEWRKQNNLPAPFLRGKKNLNEEI